MDYGNKKKKIKMAGGGAGGAAAERKNMFLGGMFKGKKEDRKKRPMKGPKVPMKMDAEGRRGMEVGGVVPYQDYVKKMFGGGKT